MVSARKALESLYQGICDVYEYQATKHPITKITDFSEVKMLSGVKCRLSFETIRPAGDEGAASGVSQLVKLFCAPSIAIKPGSKIVVTQNGVTTAYQHSGAAAVYTNHQEIILDLFKRWA